MKWKDYLLLVFLGLIFLVNFYFLRHVAQSADSATSVTVTVAQCADGSDNDGDGLIDYPADPGCDSDVDDDETDTVQVPSPSETPSVIVGPGGFSLSPSNKETNPAEILRLCDFNGDNLCNIIDFSVLLYYYNKPLPISARYDLNNDGKINLVDISILLYHWA